MKILTVAEYTHALWKTNDLSGGILLQPLRKAFAHATKPKSVLDVGIGRGQVWPYYRSEHAVYPWTKITGLDASAEMLQSCREAKITDDLHQLDLTDCSIPWPVPDNHFDAVMAENVLTLIEPAKTAYVLEQMTRKARKGGVIIFDINTHKKPPTQTLLPAWQDGTYVLISVHNHMDVFRAITAQSATLLERSHRGDFDIPKDGIEADAWILSFVRT